MDTHIACRGIYDQPTHSGDLTLVTATRDIEHSQAAVLAEWLATHNRHGWSPAD